jgi:hypothetical protein
MQKEEEEEEEEEEEGHWKEATRIWSHLKTFFPKGRIIVDTTTTCTDHSFH